MNEGAGSYLNALPRGEPFGRINEELGRPHDPRGRGAGPARVRPVRSVGEAAGVAALPHPPRTGGRGCDTVAPAGTASTWAPRPRLAPVTAGRHPTEVQTGLPWTSPRALDPLVRLLNIPGAGGLCLLRRRSRLNVKICS